MSTADVAGTRIRSTIPARLDRLSWSPFHTRMVIALGTAWVLDGLEITIASAVGAVLNKQETLGLSSTQVGAIATALNRARLRPVIKARWTAAAVHAYCRHHGIRWPAPMPTSKPHE